MLSHLTTEQQHPDSVAIDSWGAREIVELMNREDAQVAAAVGTQAAVIAAAVDRVVDRLRHGGRLLYLGAGTSGRLGVLDAAECSPTFNTPPGLVVGIIAGGPEALDASHRRCGRSRGPRGAGSAEPCSVRPRCVSRNCHQWAHALRHGRDGLRPAYRCRHDRLEL